MKRVFFLLFLLLITYVANAQSDSSVSTRLPAVSLRNVNGIIRDSTGKGLIGVNVLLKSSEDSVRTVTNDRGVFSFKGVKQATFYLTITTLSYESVVAKFLNSDAAAVITLDPIVLKASQILLEEVKISGSPTIVYKQDTIEYRAGDYKVREHATLDELLKKAEGFEVDNDGSVIHLGQQIRQVKLNGKVFAGGDVAQVTRNLPADIIDKIQVIDDYGAQAARTGIKDGPSQKILNVTTKLDRSIGNLARVNGQIGDHRRFNTGVFIQRIDAGKEFGIIGNLTNTINGIAVAGGERNVDNQTTTGSPGFTTSGSPSLNFDNQWGKSTEVSGGYVYNFSNNDAISSSYGQRYTSLGKNNFKFESTARNQDRGHRGNLVMETDLSNSDFLQINPTFWNSHTVGISNALTNNINTYSTGFEHVIDEGSTTNVTTSNIYGLKLFFFHSFIKPRRNISIQGNVERLNFYSNGGTSKFYQFFADQSQATLLQDSAVNLKATQNNINTLFEASITYSEPMSKFSQIELIAKMRKSTNASNSFQDTVLADGAILPQLNLAGNYNYSTLQQRLTLNYASNADKMGFTLGLTVLPFSLNGTAFGQTTEAVLKISQTMIRIKPSFKFSYRFSSTEMVQLGYYGENQEASFQQLQPFRDRSDPRYIVVGNPALRPAFTNTLNASYSNYLPNQRVNFAVKIIATSVQDKVTTNINQLPIPLTINRLDPSKSTFTYVNEINFINLDGAKLVSGNYSLSKQLGEKTYSLSLNGTVTYSHNPAMSNDIIYSNSGWRFVERFGPKINPTEDVEINPYVEYDMDHTRTTALKVPSTTFKALRVAIEGKIYFSASFRVNYNLSKNFITGVIGSNTNPFVINAGCQREFLQRHNLAVSLNVYDLLHQNNFVQQVATPQGVTNTLSNALSRYFLIGLKYNLQKWSGTPTRDGKVMKRRGDGSFIN